MPKTKKKVVRHKEVVKAVINRVFPPKKAKKPPKPKVPPKGSVRRDFRGVEGAVSDAEGKHITHDRRR